MLASLTQAVTRLRRGASPDGQADPALHAVHYPGLRRRRAGDLGACTRLLRVVHHEDGYPVYWPDSAQRWLDGPEVLDAFVVERVRELLGHVAVVSIGRDATSALHWRELTGCRPDQLGGVSRLFVRRRTRGEGIGGVLLDTAAVAVRARGRLPVLDMVSTGVEAQHLYTSRGWRLLASYPWGRRGDDLQIHYLRAPD